MGWDICSDKPPVFPCPCDINSHQHHRRAWCLGVEINRDNGRPYAMIVQRDGRPDLEILYLDECYTVTLENQD